MVVADGAVHGALHVERTVALGLVATLVLAIEDVEVMAPDVLVVGIEADAVLRMHHHRKVTQFHVSAVTHQYAKAMHSGIVADTLNGQIHVLPLALHLQTDGRAAQFRHVSLLQLSDDTDGQRTRLLALLVSLDDVLNAGTSLLVLASRHAQCHRLGIMLSDIDDAGTSLQRTVVVVGTDTRRHIVVGIAVAVDGAYADVFSLCGTGCNFLTVVGYGHHLHRVCPSLQTDGIGTTVRAVVAHQLCVNDLVIDIHVIPFDASQLRKLHVGRLQPALRLANHHPRLSVTLVEAQGRHAARKGIAARRLVDGDAAATDVDAAHRLSVVILPGAVLQRHDGLVLLWILTG